MEAARTAALRGHKVTIYEKGKALGGHLIEASVPGFKKDVGSLLKWYKTQLNQLGVTVKLQTAASAAAIVKENPDAVIHRFKSRIPNIPASITPCFYLRRRTARKRGKSGGTRRPSAGETALWLAHRA
jgi:2-enoate reductase